MTNSEQSNSMNLPKPRLEIEGMKAYQAPLEGRRGLLRLDFNENTIGPSPLVIEAIKNIPANQIAIYPEYSGLKEAILNNLNNLNPSTQLKPSQIGLFNGVDAAINSIFHAYGARGDQLLTTTPTFGYYNPCAQMQGMETIAVQYENSNFEFPLKKIQSTLKEREPKLLLICNPNNPTGTRISGEKLIELTSYSSKTLIVIDELYEAFTGDSAFPYIDFEATPNILLLRSLSKTAGLAGLRIGFALGNETVIDNISRVSGPYDINSFAVTAAFAALKDQKYTDAYVKEVLKAKSWMTTQLRECDRRYHIDGGNYFLIWPRTNPTEIISSLKSKGILVRDMKNKELIDGSLRVSIGTTNQMKLFWDEFKKIDLNS